MRLTDQERAWLAGEGGRASKKAMEILVALGKIYGAADLVPVSSVQIAGVSFHNLGEAGLEWLEEMAQDGRVRTLATLNPAGMDLVDWQAQGIDPGFAEQQRRLIRAYEAMGVLALCTCTPYLAGNLPAPGESVAWAESSAVAYANSILGARTNRDGGPSALAAALTGRTPRYGLHLEQHRLPTLEVEVDAELKSTTDWGALGYCVGKRGHGQVARLRVQSPGKLPELKSLCAAVVTFGGSQLFYLEGLTSPPGPAKIEQSLRIGADDLGQAIEALDDGGDQVQMVCLGCPHASLGELSEFAQALAGRRVTAETWICTARPTAEAARRLGVLDVLQASGAKVVSDTCFAVAPLHRPGATIATDSAKGCYYARGHNRLRVHLGSVERCLAAALSGRWV
jgi:predicted aconitase